MAHTELTYTTDGIVADSHRAMRGAITGARDGDRLVLNGCLPVMVVDGSRTTVMTVTETETGQTFEVLTEPGFPITTHRRDPDFEVTSIEHDPAEEHTTPIYLHKAADGKLFCSYDVAYHRLEVWLERVEATVFNHINDEVIEQLPDEDYRATTDQPSLEVGELTFTRYRLVDVDVTYHEGGN